MSDLHATVDLGGGADAPHMARALQLAQRGLYTTDPNPRVGCVLVKDGRVLAEGWHERAGEAHAEARALAAAGTAARGTTAYVTLEPCSHHGRTPPCADALLAAGIARVVCATRDPNPRVAGAGIERLRAAGVAVEVGLGAAQARALNPGFFARFERGRPFVRLKLAMSLDGRTAPSDGAPRWITGEQARADVQRLRARSSAVLTGAGTVRRDDPRLDVRLEYGPWIRQPLRVLLDPELSCAPDARMLAAPGALIYCAAEAGAAGGAARFAGATAAVETVARAQRGLDLVAVLGSLARREVNEVLVECGARLAASFLEAGLVDEWVVYVAPFLLGADGAPLAALPGAAAAALPRYRIRDTRLFGEDLRLVLEPEVADAARPAGSRDAMLDQ